MRKAFLLEGGTVDARAERLAEDQRIGGARARIALEMARRGDRAEVERIVDDRHEEVRCRDDRAIIVDPVDGVVVGRFDSDQQRIGKDTFGGTEYLAQHRGRDLAAATAAVTELREANRCASAVVHRSFDAGIAAIVAVLSHAIRERGARHVTRIRRVDRAENRGKCDVDQAVMAINAMRLSAAGVASVAR